MSKFLGGANRHLGPLDEPKPPKSDTFGGNRSHAAEEGFTTKLRLSVPDSYSTGVVCMTDLMKGFELDSLVQKKDDSTSLDGHQLWSGTGSFRNQKATTRAFKSRPCTVDTDVYFMLIENKADASAIVLPISHYYTMEPLLVPKSDRRPTEDKENDAVAEKLKLVAKLDDSPPPGEHQRHVDKSEHISNRQANRLSWDYEEAASDDEELYNNPSIMDQEEQPEDPFSLSQQKLTLYGHKMRSLLQQQEEREVDEELKQYSDDDDDSSQVGKHPRAPEASETQKKQKVQTQDPTVPSAGVVNNAKAANLEDRLIRFLKQNMGRVTVKAVLQQFNIMAKNEDFKIIQAVIQKTCTMSCEVRDGKQVKYITCKREYFNC